MIKSRVKIKHFSIVGFMSPGWVRTQVRTHSDFCWTRGLGLGLWPTGLGLWSNGLGLGLWSCGLGLTAGLTSPDSLQHWYIPISFFSGVAVLGLLRFSFLMVRWVDMLFWFLELYWFQKGAIGVDYDSGGHFWKKTFKMAEKKIT